jgi:hypothetical protein
MLKAVILIGGPQKGEEMGDRGAGRLERSVGLGHKEIGS